MEKTAGAAQNEGNGLGIDIYDYASLLSKGVTLNEFLKECGAAYVKYALDTLNSSYQAALALGTSQSSIMRRKRAMKKE